MRTIQKAGAFALIFTAKCMREALSTLADLREEAKSPARDEISALRAEVQSMSFSLQEIKESLRPAQSWDTELLQ